MKLKTTLLTIALTGSISISQAVIFSDHKEIPIFETEEDGPGGGITRVSTRSVRISPIRLSTTEGEKIDAYFNSNMGMVNVVMKNKAGFVVYRKTVSTQSDKNLSITISHLSADTYTLTFTDVIGNTINISDFSVD